MSARMMTFAMWVDRLVIVALTRNILNCSCTILCKLRGKRGESMWTNLKTKSFLVRIFLNYFQFKKNNERVAKS